MKVSDLVNSLNDFDEDMEVLITDGDESYILVSINDDGADKVLITVGDTDA